MSATATPMYRVACYGSDVVDEFAGRWTPNPDVLAKDVDGALAVRPASIHIERRPERNGEPPTLVAAGMEGRGAIVPRFLEGLRETPSRHSSDWW